MYVACHEKTPIQRGEPEKNVRISLQIGTLPTMRPVLPLSYTFEQRINKILLGSASSSLSDYEFILRSKLVLIIEQCILTFLIITEALIGNCIHADVGSARLTHCEKAFFCS